MCLKSNPLKAVFFLQLGLEDMWLSVLNFYMGPRKIAMFPAQGGNSQNVFK
jgi:hypothetical protein